MLQPSTVLILAVLFCLGSALDQGCPRPLVGSAADCPATGFDCSDLDFSSHFIQLNDWRTGEQLRCEDSKATLFVGGQAHSSLRCENGQWTYGKEGSTKHTCRAVCARECVGCVVDVPEEVSNVAVQVNLRAASKEYPCPTAFCADPRHVLYGVNATGEMSPIEDGNKLFCSGHRSWKDDFGRFFDFAICKACPCPEIRKPLSFYPLSFRQLPPSPILTKDGLCESGYSCPKEAALAVQFPSTLPTSLSCSLGTNGEWSWFADGTSLPVTRVGCIVCCYLCNTIIPPAAPRSQFTPATFYYEANHKEGCLAPNPCPNSKLLYWTSANSQPKGAAHIPQCHNNKWIVGKEEAAFIGCKATCSPLKHVDSWCPRGHFCPSGEERFLVADKAGRLRCLHGGQLFLREKKRVTLKPSPLTYCDGLNWRRPCDDRVYDGYLCAYKCGSGCAVATTIPGTTEPILKYNSNGCLESSCSNETVLIAYTSPEEPYEWLTPAVCTRSRLWIYAALVQSKIVTCAKSYPLLRDFYLI